MSSSVDYMQRFVQINELTNEHPKVELNKNTKIKISLKPHQKTILRAAIDLENKIPKRNSVLEVTTNIGILCDKVGSGKSLEILSIIDSNPQPKSSIENQFVHNVNKSVFYKNLQEYEECKKIINLPINVIVVPHTILIQWVHYIETYTTFKSTIVNNKKSRENFKTMLESFSVNDILEKIGEIILVSSTQYREFSRIFNYKFNTYKINRLIIDEADSIKITLMEKLESEFYWFITSSYSSLQSPNGYEGWWDSRYDRYTRYPYGDYDYREQDYIPINIASITSTGFIRSTFQFINDSSLNIKSNLNELIYLKNKDDFVKESFNLIDPNIFNIICRNPKELNILSNIVDDNIIHLINAGNIVGAVEKMNCNKTNETNLIQLVTEEINNEIHNKTLELEMKSNMLYTNEEHKKVTLDKIKKELETLTYKKTLLIQRIEENNVCSICYDSIEVKTILQCCHSQYCLKCLSQWFINKTNCPLCRAPVCKDKMIVVDDNHKHEEVKKEENKLKSKIENLKVIIKEQKDKAIANNQSYKFIIFTEHDRIFKEIEDYLASISVKTGYIKGHSIGKKVELFKDTESDNKIDCLLLNAEYCGAGLNLENATDIFIYNSMTYNLNKQIIGRAQRPGRTTQLNIWNLLHENE